MYIMEAIDFNTIIIRNNRSNIRKSNHENISSTQIAAGSLMLIVSTVSSALTCAPLCCRGGEPVTHLSNFMSWW